MNCHLAYLWMLEAEDPAASPPDLVAEHLRGCPKCRRRQSRVLGLMTAVRSLPPPREDPRVRAEVKAMVRELAGGQAIARPRPRRWVWWIAPAAAAALLVFGLFAWLLPSLQTPPPGNAVIAQEESEKVWEDDDLRTRLMQHNLELAEAKGLGEQLDALADMAYDLRQEALLEAGKVHNEDLTRLAMLYERVVREGVLPRARQLPPTDVRLDDLKVELAETQKEATLTAERKKEAAKPLRRLALTAKEALDRLKDPLIPLAKSPRQAEPQGLLVETLVVQGLKLADENDPLMRAEVCTDVAEGLARTIMEASKNGSDRGEMVKLGAYFGTVMDRAVEKNLDRVELTNGDARRKAEYDRIRQRADQMKLFLSHCLKDMPPPAQKNMQYSIQASRYPKYGTFNPWTKSKWPPSKSKSKSGR